MSVQRSKKRDPSPRPPVLELAGAVKTYRSSKGAVVKALDGVDLELRSGEITALLGPNGAGKTTAVRLALGLARPTAGTVRVFGRPPAAAESRQRVGTMLQISGVPATLRVREHIDLFRSYYPRPLAAAEAVATAGLADLEERLYSKLSGGQQQRLLFALALCGDPDLLFLDEPTVGLDVAARRAFWDGIRRLRAQDRSVLLTTHYLEEADALADRIVVIDRGRIVADGSPGEIKARAAARRLRFRSDLAAEAVETLPEVARVRREGPYLELLARRAEPVLRRLLAEDPDLADLEVSGAGLEEAFLALTRNSEAEAPVQGAA